MRPIGRDAEIAEIWTFISAASGAPAALSITGDAGIGKTLIWQHVLQAARSSSRVLSCRPTLAESPPAFSVLEDLFGDVAEEIMLALPGPRRRAVEVALLRKVIADAEEPPPPAGRGNREADLPITARPPPVRALASAGPPQTVDRDGTGCRSARRPGPRRGKRAALARARFYNLRPADYQAVARGRLPPAGERCPGKTGEPDDGCRPGERAVGAPRLGNRSQNHGRGRADSDRRGPLPAVNPRPDVRHQLAGRRSALPVAAIGRSPFR